MQEGYKSGLGRRHEGFEEAYKRYKETFDYKLRKHQISTERSFRVCLIDVNSGSDTKLMVKQVLDWAKTLQSKENDIFSNEICTALY